MKLQIKTRYIALAVLIVLTGLFFYGWHLGGTRAESALNASIQASDSIIQKYVVRIGNDSVYIASREQKILSQRQAIRDGDITREELRKLNLKQTNEINKLKFRIDTLLEDIGHSGEIVVVYDTITELPQNALLLPVKFSKQDKWLSLSGNFDINGKLDLAIYMSLDIDAISGVEKKTKIPILSVKTNNPYVNVIGIRSYKTDIPRIKRYGIGVQFGYGISKEGLTPYMGFGVHYSLIRF